MYLAFCCFMGWDIAEKKLTKILTLIELTY